MADDLKQRPKNAPMRPSEYMEIQREAGSCIPEFKASVVKCAKFGFFAGIPFGCYVGYRYHPRAFKPFIGTSLAASVSTFLTFTGVGVIVATYNCLRVYV
ncbi:hypothetical protein M3Y97_00630900 [Aphelenchoides bicaudatus]|nr:hypothetical protein M3Y97_00630900 [Aphelenchoides bicaudatus]